MVFRFSAFFKDMTFNRRTWQLMEAKVNEGGQEVNIRSRNGPEAILPAH